MPEDELDRLIADYVREEALHREAKALGMDQNDYIIKRRMIHSTEFITDGRCRTQAVASICETTTLNRPVG